MERSLADFPSEVLALITSHLHGFIVLRVFPMIGSKVLWHKLKHGVTHLELSRDLNAKSDLLKISSFERLLSLDVRWHGMEPSECALLLEVLPDTLTSLHIVGGLGENGWIRPENEKEALDERNVHFNMRGKVPLNLSMLFPRLRSLQLVGVFWSTSWTMEECWSPGMMIAFLRMLPRGLTSLHMQNIHDCDLPYLSYLPPHLTRFTTSVFRELRSESPTEPLNETLQNSLLDYATTVPKEGTILPLPPNLTSLKCGGRWDKLLLPHSPLLPSGLVSLTFGPNLEWLESEFNDRVLKHLPPTLKKLHFQERTTNFSPAAQWPPMLTDLKISFDRRFSTANSLPKSLTSLSLSFHDRATIFDFSSLPRSLRSLKLDIPIKSNDEMRQLPPNITTLRIPLKSSENPITFWPTSLISLTVVLPSKDTFWNLETAQALPKTLTQLVSSRMPDYVVQALPLSLMQLNLQRIEITGRIDMDYDPKAPSDKVEIPAELFFDPFRFRTISHGPISANEAKGDLYLRQPFSLRRCLPLDARLSLYKVSIGTVVSLHYFPNHITSLEFVNPIQLETGLGALLALFTNLHSLVANFGYVTSPCNMTHLTKLERLIFVNSVPRGLHSQFPPNLTELGVRDPTEEYGPPWLGPLPTSLRKLYHLSNMTILDSLKQLESLQLQPDWFSYKKVDFLTLIESLPCLTQLVTCFDMSQTQLEYLVAHKRRIELKGVVSLEMGRPEAISDIWGIKLLESTSFVHSIHQAVITYYPYLPTLQPNGIQVRIEREKTFRNLFVPTMAPKITVLQIAAFFVPDRFVRWLPRTITDLDIIQVTGTSHRTSFGLPPSLTRLMIPGNGFSLLSYQQLPHTITELKVVNQRKFWPKHAKSLPPSLRVLTLDVGRTSNSMISALPSSITSLDFGDSARSITGPALRHLPPNLTFLGGSFPGVDDISFFETFSKIHHIDSHDREFPTEYEIRQGQLKIELASSSLDELASHLINL